MSQTFSTLHRDVATGRIFSSRSGLVAPLPPRSAVVPVAGPPSPIPTSPVPMSPIPTSPIPTSPIPTSPVAPKPAPAFQFVLSGLGLPYATKAGLNASGVAQLREISGGQCSVTADLQGLTPPADQSIRPVLWLIHDLTVPMDIAPADLAALPHGVSGTGNRPGVVFTLDGNPPTYEQTGNTLSVAISPGVFQSGADGTWSLTGAVNPQTNQVFHPLVMLGPTAVADIDIALPSGVAADILQGVFMKPKTVHPELDVRSHFAQRLAAISADVLGAGAVHYSAPEQFSRAAVTLEGPLRGTPRLMPTREACILLGLTRMEG